VGKPIKASFSFEKENKLFLLSFFPQQSQRFHTFLPSFPKKKKKKDKRKKEMSDSEASQKNLDEGEQEYALHKAIWKSDFEKIQRLLKIDQYLKGINEVDLRGNAPLHIAAHFGNPKIGKETLLSCLFLRGLESS
jgi:hypothetical protein